MIRHALVVAALVVATGLAYHRIPDHGFVNYDDDLYITQNESLELGLSAEGVRWAFTTGHGANWFPLTWLSWLADQELHGLDPGALHLGNLLLHVVNAVLLYGVFVRMTGAVGRSAFVAGAFALHPLHVESVAWAAVRKDVLSGLFWMLALAAYAGYARSEGFLRYGLVLLAVALGLLAKSVLVTLPFVFLLLDVWPLRRIRSPRDPALRGALLEKVPLLALAAAASAVTFAVQRAGGAMQTVEHIALETRVANALVAYARYLGKAFWPADLAVFYPHPLDGLPLWQPATAAALLLAVSAVAVAALRRQPWIAVGWLWFLGTLVPMIGLVQVGVQSMADRYTYLPLIGLSLALAWSAHAWLARGRVSRAALGAAALAVLLALGVATERQTRVWRDGETLFRHALRATGDNHVASVNLGAALLVEGAVDEAERHLRDAIALKPKLAQAHALLGDALARRGETAEAIESFRAALGIDPSLHRTQVGLGNALAASGRPADAVGHYRAAIRLRPDFAPAYANLGFALLRLEQPAAAIEPLRRAAALDPDNADVELALGSALLQQGGPAAALPQLARAVEARPEDAAARLAYASALQSLGRDREAASQYREILRRSPDRADVLNNLAWALATTDDPALRDPPEAVRLAERAVALTGRADASILDTLSVAYAAAGRSAAAEAAAREAIARAEEAGQPELAADIASRLADERAREAK